MSPLDILWLTAMVAAGVLALGLLLAALGMLWNGEPGQTINGDRIRWPDRRWHLERRFYRHHRLGGCVIVVVAGLFFRQLAQGSLPISWPGAPPWQPVWWLLIAANGANLVIGALVLLRPSLLKPVESVVNRWLVLDLHGLVAKLADQPRLRGALLLVVAIVTLSVTAVMLLDSLRRLAATGL